MSGTGATDTPVPDGAAHPGPSDSPESGVVEASAATPPGSFTPVVPAFTVLGSDAPSCGPEGC